MIYAQSYLGIIIIIRKLTILKKLGKVFTDKDLADHLVTKRSQKVAKVAKNCQKFQISSIKSKLIRYLNRKLTILKKLGKVFTDKDLADQRVTKPSDDLQVNAGSTE